jgi:hypothetical protein
VEWFEGNFEDYEQDKIRRLAPESGLQRLDEPPARVDLSAFQPEPCRFRVGVVIAVPAFAKGQQAKVRNVEPLHGYVIDLPTLMAAPVSEMTDQPMTCQ